MRKLLVGLVFSLSLLAGRVSADTPEEIDSLVKHIRAFKK